MKTAGDPGPPLEAKEEETPSQEQEDYFPFNQAIVEGVFTQYSSSSPSCDPTPFTPHYFTLPSQKPSTDDEEDEHPNDGDFLEIDEDKPARSRRNFLLQQKFKNTPIPPKENYPPATQGTRAAVDALIGFCIIPMQETQQQPI